METQQTSISPITYAISIAIITTLSMFLVSKLSNIL